jgi:hypothetical protein
MTRKHGYCVAAIGLLISIAVACPALAREKISFAGFFAN